jgi:hypothetical protein
MVVFLLADMSTIVLNIQQTRIVKLFRKRSARHGKINMLDVIILANNFGKHYLRQERANVWW